TTLLCTPSNVSRESRGASMTFAVELAEMRYDLLLYLAPATHGADQTPVRMGLAVLSDRRVAEVHAAISAIEIARRLALRQPGWLSLHTWFGVPRSSARSAPRQLRERQGVDSASRAEKICGRGSTAEVGLGRGLLRTAPGSLDPNRR